MDKGAGQNPVVQILRMNGFARGKVMFVFVVMILMIGGTVGWACLVSQLGFARITQTRRKPNAQSYHGKR